MASVDSLPPDQRAVLELVLRRGRTYDEIAQLLSIDRAGVRERALSALDSLGPEADVPAERRALITDYLLGALPPRVTEQVRNRLGQSAAERAWARVIAAELEPISSKPLPEIPSGAPASPRISEPLPPPVVAEDEEEPFAEPASRGAAAPEERAERQGRGRARRRRESGEREGAGRLGARPPVEAGRERPSSRRGGRIVLLAAAVIVVAIVLVLVLSSGGSKNNSANQPTTPSTVATTPTTAPSTTSTPTTTTPGGTKVLAQINLNSPSGGSAKGIAEVLREGATDGVAVVAQGLQPNSSHNAYAVWLYNSPTDAHLLGFVSPGVKSDGKLHTAGALPSNASHFTKLLVTLETKSKPSTPGTVVLEGALTGL